MATGVPSSEPTAAGAATGYQPRVGGDIPRDIRDRADPAHMGPVRDATFPELIGRLINDFSALVDRQIELAKLEVREDIGEVVGAAKTLAIGAGVAAAAGLFLLVWLWTAFIWFFNFLGELLSGGRIGWVGWLVGLLVPLLIAFLAFKRFIQPGIRRVKIKPLERTRATLKEDVAWLRSQRTPSEK